MLTESQHNYLSNLTPERANSPVFLNPYNPDTEKIAERVKNKIASRISEADIRYMGASALKISGQNDVDIYILTPNDSRKEYLAELSNDFGDQIKNKWQWHEEGIEISVYLSDPEDAKFKEQLDIFEIFNSNQEIVKEYENLKLSMNGKSYKKYQTAKYEFYNRLLGITNT